MKRPVIIGVVVGLMVLAGLLYRSVRHKRQVSQLYACIGHLRLYDVAKEQWALEMVKTNGEEVVIDEMMAYINGGVWETERCPAVGRHTYTLGRVGESPRCSAHGSLGDVHLPDGTRDW